MEDSDMRRLQQTKAQVTVVRLTSIVCARCIFPYLHIFLIVRHPNIGVLRNSVFLWQKNPPWIPRKCIQLLWLTFEVFLSRRLFLNLKPAQAPCVYMEIVVAYRNVVAAEPCRCCSTTVPGATDYAIPPVLLSAGGTSRGQRSNWRPRSRLHCSSGTAAGQSSTEEDKTLMRKYYF